MSTIVYVKDAGFAQERPTTLEAYVGKLIPLAKAKGLTREEFVASQALEGLIAVYGQPRIAEMVLRNWDQAGEEGA